MVEKCLECNSINKRFCYCVQKIRNVFYGPRRIENEENVWLDRYNDIIFYRFFRMGKQTFSLLLRELMKADTHGLLKNKYRGGNFPMQPDKSLLIFLWYIANQDTLQCIGYTFQCATSTVMQIVNVVLYLILGLKKKYIVWSQTEEEYMSIRNGFRSYPGVLGAIDGSHVDLKVPVIQHDSYVDRYQKHSINLLGICNASKIFTYIFVGYPGAAHDSRVFSNSAFVKNIQNFGSRYYFPSVDYHIIGDSAFPIRSWLMTLYRQSQHIGRMEKHHNYYLSSDRVVIENIFGLVKGRWRRLIFINTYSISKAIEITTVACILHNFCYNHNDEWSGDLYEERRRVREYNLEDNNVEDARMGREKRDNIAQDMFLHHM